MAAEVLRGFPKTIQTALREGKTTYVAKLFSEEKYAEDVKNNSWDLIPVITEHLTEENKLKNNELFKCCAKLLNEIGEHSNPEEAVLQLIAEIEEAKENSKFVALLEPLYKLIARIPLKKVNSLAWSFNAIQTYIMQCETPDYETLEGKERLLVDNNEVVSNITRIYSEVIVFYKRFLSNLNKKTDTEVKRVLCKFLVQLLGNPLCYLIMDEFGNIKTDGRVLAEDIVQKVLKTISNPFILTEMRHLKENDELIKPDTLSVAHLFYLVYYEGVCFEVVPKVYNSVYMFDTVLHLLYALLDKSNNILTEKALKLAQASFLQVKCQNLSYMLLDSADHCKFCKALTHIIVYDQSECIRKTALGVFDSYLKCFEVRGVYLIISNLMGLLNHTGLIGYTITFYKDLLSNNLKNNEGNLSEYFKGPKLFSILRKFCYLRENEESNLMEASDQIISSLNFLRYLALRDKRNVTQIWDFFPSLEEFFFSPLRKGIELSRAHYELKIKEVKEEKEIDKKKEQLDVAVTVGGEGLAKMKKDETLKVLKSSLTAFDVIHSLLSRVTEITENRVS